MIPVKGNPNLYRDEKTGAIINCDDSAYHQYINSLNVREKQKLEVEILRNEVDELKTLIKELINESRRN